MSEEYNADQIQVLEGLEAFRKRPGMYIGSTSSRGLHHLVYEIVDNSVDEALAGYCSEIEVTVHRDNSVTVKDNGRGIPDAIQKNLGIPAAGSILNVVIITAAVSAMNADVYDQTDSKFFSSGESMWLHILEDLKKAEKFIFLEYYIVEEGLMWDSMLDILEQKAAQGVEVKMLYDDIGCMATLPVDYTIQLRGRGIEAHKFNKVIPRLTVAYNNRDHRKILVIDGQVAYTGGINLADEYINHVERFGYWKDSGIRIDGPGVKALTRLFLMTWYINRGEISDFDQYHLENQSRSGQGLCIPYGSGPKPIFRTQVGKKVYQSLINQATDSIYITTPYLIIDYDLTESIKNAAMRGVDVRIVTPFIPDKKLIQLITRGAYPDLLLAGVRIFEYSPGFIHSKQMLVDSDFASVGTINLDYRSLLHHYENAVLLYKTESIAEIQEDFEEIFSISQEIFLQTIKNSWYQKLIKEIAQLLAPIL